MTYLLLILVFRRHYTIVPEAVSSLGRRSSIVIIRMTTYTNMGDIGQKHDEERHVEKTAGILGML